MIFSGDDYHLVTDSETDFEQMPELRCFCRLYEYSPYRELYRVFYVSIEPRPVGCAQ